MEEEKVRIPKIVRNRFLRFLLLAGGFLFTFLALLGAVLPLVPTTPFLIAAAACFYRSSDRFYNMIMNNRYFGHYLRDYQSGKGIPLRVKIVSLGFMWLSTLISLFFFIPYLWLKLLVVTFSAAVTVHIVKIRTKKAG